jgi:serine phosphatase RsbU (regulator of sigma subunit)
LLELVSASQNRGEELLEEIFASIQSFAGGRPEADDQTLLTAAID